MNELKLLGQCKYKTRFCVLSSKGPVRMAEYCFLGVNRASSLGCHVENPYSDLQPKETFRPLQVTQLTLAGHPIGWENSVLNDYRLIWSYWGRPGPWKNGHPSLLGGGQLASKPTTSHWVCPSDFSNLIHTGDYCCPLVLGNSAKLLTEILRVPEPRERNI